MIIITYDIKEDKRRNKVFNMLKDFGTHVQFSVFEIYITDKKKNKFHREPFKKVDRY